MLNVAGENRAPKGVKCFTRMEKRSNRLKLCFYNRLPTEEKEKKA